MNLKLHVFELLEKTTAPRGNPSRPGEKMHTPHRKTTTRWQAQTQKLLLTTAPPRFRNISVHYSFFSLQFNSSIHPSIHPSMLSIKVHRAAQYLHFYVFCHFPQQEHNTSQILCIRYSVSNNNVHYLCYVSHRSINVLKLNQRRLCIRQVQILVVLFVLLAVYLDLKNQSAYSTNPISYNRIKSFLSPDMSQVDLTTTSTPRCPHTYTAGTQT